MNKYNTFCLVCLIEFFWFALVWKSDVSSDINAEIN